MQIQTAIGTINSYRNSSSAMDAFMHHPLEAQRREGYLKYLLTQLEQYKNHPTLQSLQRLYDDLAETSEHQFYPTLIMDDTMDIFNEKLQTIQRILNQAITEHSTMENTRSQVKTAMRNMDAQLEVLYGKGIELQYAVEQALNRAVIGEAVTVREYLLKRISTRKPAEWTKLLTIYNNCAPWVQFSLPANKPFVLPIFVETLPTKSAKQDLLPSLKQLAMIYLSFNAKLQAVLRQLHKVLMGQHEQPLNGRIKTICTMIQKFKSLLTLFNQASTRFWNVFEQSEQGKALTRQQKNAMNVIKSSLTAKLADLGDLVASEGTHAHLIFAYSFDASVSYIHDRHGYSRLDLLLQDKYFEPLDREYIAHIFSERYTITSGTDYRSAEA